MPSLITCTPGGAADNAYLDLEDADAYFADTLRAETWATWPEVQRERALIQATGEIERLGGAKATDSAARQRFPGSPQTSMQALHFPRSGDTDADGVYLIPAAVREAVCEQAFWLLGKQDNPDLLPREELRARGVTSVSVDGLSESYGPNASGAAYLAPRAWELMRPLVRRSWRTTL